MTTPIPQVKRALASLKLPRSIPALISLGKSMVRAMTANPSFPNPTPTLAAVTAAVTELDAAETAAKTRVHGAVAVRNDKRTALVALLEELKAYIQKIADANLENAAAIVQSAGINVRKPPVRAPRAFVAKAGAVSGTVKLVTPSAGHRASYEWQSSSDGGKTWVPASVTLKAKATLSSLTPGATMMFRYRPVTKAGEGDWSQPTSLIVK